jgi:hypothetical protein
MNKPSWLFWVIAVLALLSGLFNVFDFYMTSSGNEAYLKDFPQEMIGWIQGFPLWRYALWGTTVIAGLAGAILMLARNKYAPLLFWVSVATGVFGFVVHDLVMANGLHYYGTLGTVVSVILISVWTGFALYANRAKSQGYLS